MGSGKKVTVGYRYYAGMHIVVCRALDPTNGIDGVNRIRVGERDAWTTPVRSSQRIYINAPTLFGGDKREGGVVGYVDVEFGAANQGRNAYLASKVNANISAHRGVLGLVLNRPQLSALNPYLKPWSVEVTRRPGGGWSPANAMIGQDANPAHIVYEVLTNAEWGLGYSSSDIDTTAFSNAASTLATEGLGLSLVWGSQNTHQEFLQLVMRHINAALFVNPLTGLWSLRLIRGDYVGQVLPTYDESSIISVESFQRTTPSEMYNTYTVHWMDRNGAAQATTVYDIAGLSDVGQEIATSVDLLGIADVGIATKIALRDLAQISQPLARVTIILTRAASGTMIGDVIRLTLAEYQLVTVAFRVINISYGTLESGNIKLELVQDVFALPQSSYLSTQSSLWSTPYTQPAVVPNRVLMESPWWVVVQEITGENTTAQNSLDPTSGYLLAGAQAPSADTIDYDVWVGTSPSTLSDHGAGNPTPTGTLAGTFTADLTTTNVPLANFDRLDWVLIGSWAVINPGAANEELVEVTALDLTTNPAVPSLTVQRGILDTVPQSHAVGERIWFLDGYHFCDSNTYYLTGQTIYAKFQTQTALGMLDISTDTATTYTFNERFNRPYAPGNVKVNNVSYPSNIPQSAGVSVDLSITWAHRDRLLETTLPFVHQTDANVGPEPSTTYTVNIYNTNARTGGTLIHSYTGLTGTSQAYTVAQATTDNGGTKPAGLRVEIQSLVGTYTSWQKQVMAFTWS